MKLWRSAFTLLIIFIFTVLFLYFTLKWRSSIQKEEFQAFDVQKLISDLIRARGEREKQNSYLSWVGWLYKNVETSGAPLNDFKSRVFNPNCKFRRDWATNIPPGLTRPIPAGSKDLANVAYRSYLSCLAQGNQVCIGQLEDARRRFMEPDCSILRPDPSSYTRNVKEVFV